MRFVMVVVGCMLVTPVIAAEVAIKVPSDPKAKYYALERSGTGAQRVILTKRVGPSGTSYSKRLYNCANNTVKYLADADTLDGLANSKPDPKMGPILDGSIAYYVGLEACKSK